MNHTNTFFIDNCTCVLTLVLLISLPTARDNVFTGVCHSVHNWPHAYSVSAHPCWLLSHLFQCGWYASYWNAYLLLSAMKWRRLCFYRCVSVHRGVSASVHAGIPHPPLGADTPPRADTPGSRHPPEQTPPIADPPKSRHPQEQTLPQEQTPQEQTPPQE